MIVTNYFGGDGGNALKTGWNDFWTAGAYSANEKAAKEQATSNRRLEESQAQQLALAQENQRLQERELSQRQSYLSALLSGDKSRDTAQKDLEASDLAAQVIAGREGNRQAALNRAEALAGARQAGAGSPLAALLAAGAAQQGAQAGRTQGYSTGMNVYNQSNANAQNALNSAAGGSQAVAQGAQGQVASLTNSAANTNAAVVNNLAKISQNRADNTANAGAAAMQGIGNIANIALQYGAGA